jgi:hypothetical protein
MELTPSIFEAGDGLRSQDQALSNHQGPVGSYSTIFEVSCRQAFDPAVEDGCVLRVRLAYMNFNECVPLAYYS